MNILRKMSSCEFDKYIENAIIDYANDKIESGNWTEDEAFIRSRSEYNNLLPDGVDSDNNHLFSIINESNEVVGMIWLNEKENKSSFIYDISINENHQGKGYGYRAMKEIEGIASSLGLEKIELHVFGHNKIARNLYDKLGYKETNIMMSKSIK